MYGRVPHSRMASRVLRLAAAVLVVVASGIAALSPAGSTPDTLRALDCAVGLALGLAAAVAAGPLVPRLLLGATSLAWSAATLWPVLWHQGLLLAALLTLLPAGAGAGPARAAALVGAVTVGTGWGGQGFAALVGVASAAAIAAEDGRTRRAARTWYAVAGALALAAVWTASWAWQRWFPREFDPAASFVTHAALLLSLAGGFLLLGWSDASSSGRRLARALETYDPSSVDPTSLLEAALGEAVGDDRLSLLLAPDAAPGAGPGEHVLRLTDPDSGRVRAVVTSRSPALRDEEVRRRMLEVLDLVATDAELAQHRRDRVAELEAARRRLLLVGDDERGRVMDLLGTDVVPRLRSAVAHIDRLRSLPPDLVQVRDDLRAMEVALDGLVAGHPPAGLGDGALPGVVRRMAGRAPVPVTVSIENDPRGSRVAETALYYVFSEGLANVVRHAVAGRVEVTISTDAGDLVLRVEDDGVGGADEEGSGLKGLADRMDSLGGRLRVRERTGGGTVLEARVSRSASTEPR